MKKYIYLLLSGMMVLSCNNNKVEPDAWGNFEAVDVIVSAEAQGKLTLLKIEEGMALDSGIVVGVVDTTALYLKKLQLLAQLEALQSKYTQINAQIAVQEEQKATLSIEKERFAELVKQNAAPQKQFDDITGQIGIIEKQIASTRTQNQGLAAELKSLGYQVAQIEDQIKKSVIRNPIQGVVLEKYQEPGEMTIPGKAIYKIAQIATLKLRVYVSGDQLASIKLGNQCSVYVDSLSNELKMLKGKISWISDQSEFTPKIIQTRKERVNFVYAVKIDVPNDGSLKIGMPGEVKF